MNDVPRHHRFLRSAVLTAGLLTASGLLWIGSGRGMLGQATGNSPLPACEANETLFPTNASVPDGSTIVDVWAKAYHDIVRTVINEHLQQLREGGRCEDGAEMQATEALDRLAKNLGRDDAREEDLPAVLLAYLEAYECTLQAEVFIVQPRAQDTIVRRQRNKGEPVSVSVPGMQREAASEERRIWEEMKISREAMHRTLLYLSGQERFLPLSSALQCLAGATVDIRNNLDLAAEASACLPRIWDARTSLRTLNAP